VVYASQASINEYIKTVTGIDYKRLHCTFHLNKLLQAMRRKEETIQLFWMIHSSEVSTILKDKTTILSSSCIPIL